MSKKSVALSVLAACALAPMSYSQAVTTYHYNNFRTGANTEETILTPSNVASGQFGKLFSLAVNGQVYAQPLYVPALTINNAVHNVLYVATENNDVYAFDADAAGPALWHVNLGAAQAFCCGDLTPQVGITSTPVIDLSRMAIYVVSATQTGLGTQFTLHSLDIRTGADRVNPAVVKGSVAGTGDGSSGGVLNFNPTMHWQRTALLLDNGIVYFAFGGHQDTPPFHGWIFAYDATSLRRLMVKCTTPNGSDGGIWQGGAGLSATGDGYIYAVTGNGTFDASSGGSDYGMSVIKLNARQNLAVTDYFAASNEAALSNNDIDMGTTGPLLVPGANVIVNGDKAGRMYVTNANALGGFSATDHSLQEWQSVGPFFGTPAFYNSTLYYWGTGGSMQARQLHGSTFSSPVSGPVTTTFGYEAAPALTVSANGNQDGIVWATYPPSGLAWGPAFPGVLQAFDASNVGTLLWTSPADSTSPDYTGSWSKWCPPTVVNGKLYLATFDGAVNVYGLKAGSN